jgi:hypothetical protein
VRFLAARWVNMRVKYMETGRFFYSKALRERMGARMSVAELVWAICGDRSDELGVWLGGRMAASPRFRLFVEEHRDKIGKKVRAARDVEGVRDLALELEVAYRLLSERRFALRYEAYAAGKTRGPDFTVIYKERPTCNVEVKRLRGPLDAGAFGKWANAICDKAAQVPPSIANVALIGAQGRDAADFDAAGAMARLRRLAEGGDDAFFARRGYHDARDFLRTLPRLSAVLYVAGWDAEAADTVTLWVNALAKHQLAPEVARMLAGVWVADAGDPTR